MLLDGKTVLNGYFDFAVWEEIPVTLEEIDRIEVVEGAVSALYGANALGGVINIITKSPRQIEGGAVSYGFGGRSTQIGSALYGREKGNWAYKFGAGWRSTNRFEDAGALASQTGKFHAWVGRRLLEDGEWSASGGISEIKTQVTTGNNGTAVGAGPTGFARTDLRVRDSRARFFWNRSRLEARDFAALQSPNMDYDTYDLTLDRVFDLPFAHSLVAGGGYRKNTLRSRIFQPGLLEQDLWALFLEDQWEAGENWTAVASARLDRHPLAPLNFSPRGSLIYSRSSRHVFRFSAGTSFRNPTLLENYLNLVRSDPSTTAPFTTQETTLSGSPNLNSERIALFELSHAGAFERVKTRVAAFHYRLADVIATTPAAVTCGLACFPTLKVNTSFANQGQTKAWGGEAGVEALLARHWKGLANYSYQSLTDDRTALALSAPRHKLNSGLEYGSGGFLFNLRAHWVDKTFWNRNRSGTAVEYAKVPDYLLLNANASYSFRGWEASVGVFNLLNRDHYEILPRQSALLPGQGGEIIRSLWTAGLSHRF